MIQSFSCKETEKLFKREKNMIHPQIQRVALRKLLMIDAATSLGALAVPPNNRLELLQKDRRGQHSIRINDQYRICFVWKEGLAHDVEIIDYH